ncbi:hypothetical protein D081_1159 [Anaerovibrio sp. JC8]|nr:hypothetical protein D081_1159 [Anaerovibrio sp. JC8]
MIFIIGQSAKGAIGKSTEDFKEMTLAELLPMSFGPEFLK